MKSFIMCLLFISTLFAKVDFSEMSTQELLAMIGYVKPVNEQKLEQELKVRYPKMNEKEKIIYIKNIDKIKKK